MCRVCQKTCVGDTLIFVGFVDNILTFHFGAIIVQYGLCVVFLFATTLKTMTLRIACASIPDVCVAPQRRCAPTCTREEGVVKPVKLSRVMSE
jgi:hypothetical protein